MFSGCLTCNTTHSTVRHAQAMRPQSDRGSPPWRTCGRQRGRALGRAGRPRGVSRARRTCGSRRGSPQRGSRAAAPAGAQPPPPPRAAAGCCPAHAKKSASGGSAAGCPCRRTRIALRHLLTPRPPPCGRRAAVCAPEQLGSRRARRYDAALLGSRAARRPVRCTVGSSGSASDRIALDCAGAAPAGEGR